VIVFGQIRGQNRYIRDLRILKGIISIAREMGLEVIAEGVETQAQVDYLKSHECFLVQGYYFNPPLRKEELLSILASQ
jgi:EAL domain-containing protein (putative c-di-GMP-specific phosphodiesterase class I)